MDRGPKEPKVAQLCGAVGRSRRCAVNAGRIQKKKDMALLKSKGLWITVAVTLIVMAIVNRVPAVRSLIYGA